jgi:serine protease Do
MRQSRKGYGRLRLEVLCAGLSFAICILPQASAATQQPPDPLHQLSSSFESLANRVSPAVVEVFVSGYGAADPENHDPAAPVGRQSSLGSGVIVDPDGYIVTNFHVIEGAQRVNVLITPSIGSQPQARAVLRARGRMLPAKIVGGSKAADLAVLKIDANGLPTIPFAPYAQLRQGQVVFAFGNPEGLQNSMSMGLVSSVLRQADPESPMVFIQTDAAINPGNSGGPLVDVDGNLVGINSSILTQSGGNEGIGFAIPSGIVLFVYKQIRQHGHVQSGEIGAEVQPITRDLAAALALSNDTGVIVSNVLAGGPAEQAGLKVADLIQTIDGNPIDSVPTFTMSIYLRRAGDRVRVGILRGREKLSFTVPVIEKKQGAESVADYADPDKGLIADLGIIGADLTPELAALMPQPRLDSGVVVAATTSDHRADEVGLQFGDIIHALNNVSVTNLSGLRSALHTLKPGDPAALQIERNGRLMFVTFDME